jgi:hypothetical protein
MLGQRAVPAALSERERVIADAGVEELDLERPIRDGPRLPKNQPSRDERSDLNAALISEVNITGCSEAAKSNFSGLAGLPPKFFRSICAGI